jgi:hypothetical protein
MNATETFRATEATSSGATFGKPLVLVGVLLVGLGTSPAAASRSDVALTGSAFAEQTSAGGSVEGDFRAGAAIAEIRRVSGLNWEQLSRVFGVTRRALHFWASGKPMASTNEERLHRVLATVRIIDRGSPDLNRTALFGARRGGVIPFDLFVGGSYDSLIALVGEGHASRRRSPIQPADAGRVAKPSYPPDELLATMQDRVHLDMPGARAVRTAKVKGSGGR